MNIVGLYEIKKFGNAQSVSIFANYLSRNWSLVFKMKKQVTLFDLFKKTKETRKTDGPHSSESGNIHGTSVTESKDNSE